MTLTRNIKKIKYIVLCCVSLLFFSCIREDIPECPPEVNLRLTFSYLGDTGEPSMFARCIDYVTLMVYDKNENRVLRREINKNELTRLQGAELILEPGKYTIVCWGNSHEYTQFDHSESFANGRLHHPNLPDGIKIPTNSHLYYGVYNAVIPEQGAVQGNIPFSGAHINIEVYVRGMASVDTPDNWPQIEMHNLMPQYTMEMKPAMAYATTYYPETGYNMQKNLNETLFQTLLFRDNNPVYLEIKSRAGESLLSIGLEEFMAANGLSVNGKNEATIPVLVEFTDLGVAVRVPEWFVNEVQPE